MKFQPGDRVVFIKSYDMANDVDVGRRAIITKRYVVDIGVVVLFDGDKTETSWYYDRRFVLEYIYDSPLYEAIK